MAVKGELSHESDTPRWKKMLGCGLLPLALIGLLVIHMAEAILSKKPISGDGV